MKMKWIKSDSKGRITVLVQSRTTKGRLFYCARTREIGPKLILDSDSDGLVTSENDFFVFFPRLLGDRQNFGRFEHIFGDRQNFRALNIL